MEQDQRKKAPFDSPLPGRLGSNPAIALLSHLYAATVNTRNFAYDSIPALSKDLGRPVISVGGIRAGGTGKTPVAKLIAQHIINNCGYGVAFLSRGYGRASKRTVIVRPNETADWQETGDEPWMLHANIPESWLGIGADRAAVAKKLSPLLPEKTVFVLDDGFQHRKARRDLDIVCLSEGALRDRMMPAGYLRDSVSALRRAGVVLVAGAEERAAALRETAEAVERKLLLSKYANDDIIKYAGDASPKSAEKFAAEGGSRLSTPEKAPICAVLLQYPDIWVEARTGQTSATPPIKNPVVISGIARPERFLAALRSLSVEPAEFRVFPDHHKFKRKNLACGHNIYLERIVTTEKDAVRLLSPEFAALREIWYLKTTLRFADPGSEAAVLSVLNSICRTYPQGGDFVRLDY